MALLVLRNVLGRTDRNEFTAAVAAIRAHVDDPVGDLDDVEIVLDHHDGVAGIHQFLQHFHQRAHVVEMQAGGRLVENVHGAAGGTLRELLGKLDALRLAAGQRGGLLANLHIAESDAAQRFHLAANAWHGPKEHARFFDRHVQHIGDRLAFIEHFQRFAVVAFALADITGDIDVGQEVHFDLDDAIALARFAAAAFHVEGEAAGLIATRLGFGEASVPVADGTEGAGVCRRVRARRAADGRLIDVDNLVEVFDAFDLLVRRGAIAGAVETAGEGLVERLDDERGLAAAGDAGNAGEDAERDFGGNVLQVVAGRADDADHLLLVGPAAFCGDGDFFLAGEILAGDGALVRHQVFG